jgi:hypothetical protein
LRESQEKRTDNHKAQQDGSRATSLERAAGANEETSTNGTTAGLESVRAFEVRPSCLHSNHLHMAALQVAVESVLLTLRHGLETEAAPTAGGETTIW